MACVCVKLPLAFESGAFASLSTAFGYVSVGRSLKRLKSPLFDAVRTRNRLAQGSQRVAHNYTPALRQYEQRVDLQFDDTFLPSAGELSHAA